MSCEHRRNVLLCLDTGRGGLQYRHYCRRCWSCTAGPLDHGRVAQQAVLAGRRPKVHTDGTVVWAPVVTTPEIERRRRPR
jgi:hypothetical protein